MGLQISQHTELSLLAPPAVGLSVLVDQRSDLPMPLAFLLPALPHHAPPVRYGYQLLPADQHLHHGEVLLRGVCPDLAAMEVAQHRPAAIAAARGGEVPPIRINLGLAAVVVHEHPLAIAEPLLQTVL